MYLVYGDGRLISCATLENHGNMDEDILGGMLSAIMNLIKVAIVNRGEGKEHVDNYRFKFGERSLIIDTRELFFIAIVLLGKENNSLKAKSQAVISDIEQKYESALVDWKGELDDFEGIDNIILTLLPLDKLSEEEREAIMEYENRSKIINLWSKMHQSIIQEALLPKPHMWKNFNLKLDAQNKKKNGKENTETSE